MIKLLPALLLSLLLQGGEIPSVSIPVKDTSFTIGYNVPHVEDLGVTPREIQKPSPGWQYVTEGNYTLKFTVINYFASYPGYYDAQVSFGSQELCSVDGWAGRTPTEITLVCPASGYLIIDKALPNGGPVQGDKNLVLNFSVPGWQLLFSNVQLSFAPDAP